MPSVRRKPLFPVALSPAECSTCCSIPYTAIQRALYTDCTLESHLLPSGAVRVLVADLTEWIRSHPPATKKRWSKLHHDRHKA